MNPQPVISFENTENAFPYKSDGQLKKANYIFSIMQFQWLVNWGVKITPYLLKLRLPINGLIRKTIFKQFCGGETLEETAIVAQQFGKYQVQLVLDYGIEGIAGEENFEAAVDEIIRVINYASTQQHIPFVSIKITGYAPFSLLQKINENMLKESGDVMEQYFKVVEKLSQKEGGEWKKVVDRANRIVAAAAEKHIGLLIDAEESWIQNPVDALCMQLMEKYNKNRCIVYNTIQHYRFDRLTFLKWSFGVSVEREFVLGAKLVRGAYMEKERKRAIEFNYPSPIQSDKVACDKDYNLGIEFCISNLEKISLIVASHNEFSNLYAAQLLQQKSISLNHPHIHWSQLFGMSDNITFNLAKAGCSVSKYLPFGPIKDVIPYLMRRAQENTSIGGQTGKELGFIRKEIQRRKLLKY